MMEATAVNPTRRFGSQRGVRAWRGPPGAADGPEEPSSIRPAATSRLLNREPTLRLDILMTSTQACSCLHIAEQEPP
jgi:hypothetical protein